VPRLSAQSIALKPGYRKDPINARLNVLVFLLVIVAAVIGLHRFSPVDWPPLAVDILHSLHGTGFALLGLIVFWYLQRRFPSSFNYLMAAIITMAIGFISEAAQIPGPRDAQISDLIIDALGIFGALGILVSFDAKIRQHMKRPLRLLLPPLAAIALSIACLPTLWFSYALAEQYRAFPVLLTFEHAWESATFRTMTDHKSQLVPAPTTWPVSGDTVAKAKERGRWGIFITLRPWQDWRAFSKLTFVAASNHGRFAMDIGVRDIKQGDEYHGIRYYKRVWVDETPQRFTVTFEEIQSAGADRSFDFSHVEAIMLSAATPGNGTEILIDDFRLDK